MMSTRPENSEGRQAGKVTRITTTQGGGSECYF